LAVAAVVAAESQSGVDQVKVDLGNGE